MDWRDRFKFGSETAVPKIVFEEKRSKITFENPQRKTYVKIDVDGVEIKQGKRCDNMLLKYDCDPYEEYFVELNGCDIAHAIEQLSGSIEKLSIDPKLLHKYAFVVAVRVSPKVRSDIQIAKKKFRDGFNAELIIKEKEYTHHLNRQ